MRVWPNSSLTLRARAPLRSKFFGSEYSALVELELDPPVAPVGDLILPAIDRLELAKSCGDKVLWRNTGLHQEFHD